MVDDVSLSVCDLLPPSLNAMYNPPKAVMRVAIPVRIPGSDVQNAGLSLLMRLPSIHKVATLIAIDVRSEPKA